MISDRHTERTMPDDDAPVIDTDALISAYRLHWPGEAPDLADPAPLRRNRLPLPIMFKPGWRPANRSDAFDRKHPKLAALRRQLRRMRRRDCRGWAVPLSAPRDC